MASVGLVARLVVRRRPGLYAAFRELKIYVDGRLVGRLRAGQHLDLQVEVGVHVVETALMAVRARTSVLVTDDGATAEVAGGGHAAWALPFPPQFGLQVRQVEHHLP